MRTRFFLVGFLALALAPLACSSSPAAPSQPPPADAAATVTQKGLVLDFTTHHPVPGATVTAAGQTVTADASGAYSFDVQPGLPFTMSVHGPNHATLLTQERVLDANVDDGGILLPSEDAASLLRLALNGYDQTLGSVSAFVIPTGKCDRAEGATVSISPAGAARVMYFKNGLPSVNQTSVAAGELPSVVFYNVQPGVPLTLSVTHPSCKQVPFPTKQLGVHYTGALRAEAGDQTTYASVFVE